MKKNCIKIIQAVLLCIFLCSITAIAKEETIVLTDEQKKEKIEQLLQAMNENSEQFRELSGQLGKSKSITLPMKVSSKINEIRSLYGKVTSLDSSVAEAYLIMADVYFRHTMFDEALKILDRWEKNNADNAKILLMRTKVFIVQGKYDLASDSINKALLIEPTNIDLLTYSIFVNKILKNYGAMIVTADKIIESYSKTNTEYAVKGYAAKAEVYFYNKEIADLNKALADINKAIALSETQELSYYKLRHRINDALKNYDAVIMDFEIMQKLDSSTNEALFNKAQYLASLDRNEEAIKAYTEFINLEPNNEKGYVNRGIIYRKTGDLTKAVEDYNRAIEINPKDPYVYSNLGYAYTLQGKYKEALECYEKGKKINLKTFNYINEITTYIKMSDFKNAYKCLKQYYEMNKAESKKTGKPIGILKRIYDEWQENLEQHKNDKNVLKIQEYLTKFVIV